MRRVFRKLNSVWTSTFHHYYAIKRLYSIITKKDTNEVVIIMPQLIGDVTYAMAYLNAYCKKLEVEGKTATVQVALKRKDIIDLFRIISTNCAFVFLEDEREIRYNQYILQYNRAIKIGINNGVLPTVPYYMLNLVGGCLDSLSILRQYVFTLPENSPIDYPMVPLSSGNCDINKSNKIAVINPYSNSLSTVDFVLFEMISDYLSENGYDVWTNVVKDQKPITGTKPLLCTINDFYNICNCVSLVVSVRSGILDFCVNTHAAFYVVYFGKRIFKDLYTFKGWNRPNTYETIYSSREDGIEEFKSYFISSFSVNNQCQ